MNKNNKKSSFKIESLIIIAIAICMIFLNTFTTSKLNELDRAATEAMFIKEDIKFPDNEQFGQEIVKYRQNSYKMIEMYDNSFELLLSLQFDQDQSYIQYNIEDYPELIEILKSNKEGNTNITINGYEEEIYFQWSTNSRNEDRLVMVYSTKKIVNNLWVFSFVCYLVLILIFTLLIKINIKEYRYKVNQYKRSSSNVRREINDR